MAVSGEESGLLFIPECLKSAHVCQIKIYVTCTTKERCGELSCASLLLLVLWQTPLSKSFLNAVQILTVCQALITIHQLSKHAIATVRGDRIDITQDTVVIPVALYTIPHVNTHN